MARHCRAWGPPSSIFIFEVISGDLIVVEDEPIMQLNCNLHFPNWVKSYVYKKELIFAADFFFMIQTKYLQQLSSLRRIAPAAMEFERKQVWIVLASNLLNKVFLW